MPSFTAETGREGKKRAEKPEREKGGELKREKKPGHLRPPPSESHKTSFIARG